MTPGDRDARGGHGRPRWRRASGGAWRHVSNGVTHADDRVCTGFNRPPGGPGVSLEAREAKIRAMATVQSADLLDVIVDGGESAKPLNRPALQRLLAQVSEGKVGRAPRPRCDCAVTSAVRGGVPEHPGIPTGLKTILPRPNWTDLNRQPACSIPVSATMFSITYKKFHHTASHIF